MSSITNSISQFATSGMWTHRQAMINISLGVPIAIEVIVLGKKLFENRKAIRAELVKVKDLVVDSFSARDKETKEAAQRRIAKNAGKVFAATLFLGSAVAMPFLMLPALFAIPLAITAIITVGKILSKHKTIELKLKNAVQVVSQAFTIQPGEIPEIARKRIAKNIIKATVAIILVAAITATLAYTIQTGLLASGLSSLIQLLQNSPLGQAISEMMSQFAGSGWVSFPQPSELMSYALYGIVALANVVQAIRCYKKGEKMRALYHVAGSLLSIIFPMVYLLQGETFRLHHSFYGLIAMLVPFRAFNFFGALMTADSYTYFFQSARGYITNEWWGNQLHIYDYSNIFVENFVLFIGVFVALSAFQLLMNRLFKKKQEKTVEKTEIVQPSKENFIHRPKLKLKQLSAQETMDAQLETLKNNFTDLESQDCSRKQLLDLRKKVGSVLNAASGTKFQKQYFTAADLYAEISEKLNQPNLKAVNS